jgi:hypothetical protein
LATQTLESIPCKTCNGQMSKTAVRRFSSGIVFMGYTLLIPSVLILLLSSACAVVTCGTTTQSAADQLTRQKDETATRLRGISELPQAVIADFEQDGILEPAALNALSEEKRQEVQRVLDLHLAGQAGTALGATAVGGIGTAMIAVVYFFFLPAMIVGALLTLRKNVWACGQCGGIIDRK